MNNSQNIDRTDNSESSLEFHCEEEPLHFDEHNHYNSNCNTRPATYDFDYFEGASIDENSTFGKGNDLIAKEMDLSRREEQNELQNELLDQRTQEVTLREKEIARREEELDSQEMNLKEKELHLTMLQDELENKGISYNEYLDKKKSIEERRNTLQERTNFMKGKNHEAMEKLMNLVKSKGSVSNVEDLFRMFDLPSNLNERLGESLYPMIFNSQNLDDIPNETEDTFEEFKTYMETEFLTLKARFFFLLTERDVVILNLKRKLVEKDHKSLARDYALGQEEKEKNSLRKSNPQSEVNDTLTSQKSSRRLLNTGGNHKGTFSANSALTKKKQALEQKREELLLSLTDKSKKNEEDLERRVKILKERESNVLNWDGRLSVREQDLARREENLKSHRKSLTVEAMTLGSSASRLSFDVEGFDDIQLEKLDTAITISVQKDKEAIEALTTELITNDSSLQGMRADLKKKEEEGMQLRVSVMKGKVKTAFSNESLEDKVSKEQLKSMEIDIANMKAIIKNLENTSRKLKLDIKKREDIVRKKKKIEKAWSKVENKTQEVELAWKEQFVALK